MKKILGLTLILLVITIGLLIFRKAQRMQQVFTFKKSHNRLYREDFSLPIDLYFEDEKNYFKELDEIIEAKIYSKSNPNSLKIEIVKIERSIRIYQGREVMEQKYSVLFQNLGDDLYLQNANLYLKNYKAEEIDISIGDVYAKYQREENGESLNFTEIFGVFNTIKNIKTLCGIFIQLEGRARRMEITKIELGDSGIYVNSKNIFRNVLIEENDCDLTEINPQYQIIEEREDFYPFSVDSGDSLLMMLSYDKIKFLGNTYLIMDYKDENNQAKTFILQNFNFIRILDLNELKGSIEFYGYS